MALEGDTLGVAIHDAFTAGGRSSSPDALARWKVVGGAISSAVNAELGSYPDAEAVDELLEDYYTAAEVDGLLPAGSALRHAVATPGAEVANVIAVAVQIQDGGGQNVEEATPLLATLLNASLVPELEAAFTMTQTGGALTTADNKPALLVTTGAGGAITLSVTDAGGASGLTTYLKLEPLPGVGKVGQAVILPLTFDGA